MFIPMHKYVCVYATQYAHICILFCVLSILLYMYSVALISATYQNNN